MENDNGINIIDLVRLIKEKYKSRPYYIGD